MPKLYLHLDIYTAFGYIQSIATLPRLINFFNCRTSRSSSRLVSSRHASGHSTWHTSGHSTRHTSGHSTRHSTRHSTWHSWHTTSTTRLLIQLGNDWIAHAFYSFLLILKFVDFGQLIGIKPFNSFIAFTSDGLLITVAYLIFKFLIINRRLHVETIGF